jgi:hypothetical protein
MPRGNSVAEFSKTRASYQAKSREEQSVLSFNIRFRRNYSPPEYGVDHLVYVLPRFDHVSR